MPSIIICYVRLLFFYEKDILKVNVEITFYGDKNTLLVDLKKKWLIFLVFRMVNVK